jgi:hypothetical protein
VEAMWKNLLVCALSLLFFVIGYGMGMVDAGLDTARKLTQTRSDAYALALLFYEKQQEGPQEFF